MIAMPCLVQRKLLTMIPYSDSYFMNDLVLKRIFILAAIVAFFYILYLLTPVVVPFITAFLLAYLFSPIVGWIEKRGFSRAFSTSMVFFAMTIIAVIIVWYILPILWKQIIYIRDSIPSGIRWFNQVALPWLSKNLNIEMSNINLDEIFGQFLNYVQTNYNIDNAQAIFYRLAQSGLSIIQIGGIVVLIPIITFYFLLDWNRMLVQAQRLIPRPMEMIVLKIVKECHAVLGAFVKGQFLVMILLGTVYAVGLQLIGLETGIVIGIAAGLASIIPYLGFAVGIIAAAIATFFQFGLDWTQLFLVVVVFMIGQAVEGYILQPFLLGDKIGLSPVAVVFAVLAGAQLMGFVGMLIALPVAAILVVLLKHWYERYERSEFYGAVPASLPEEVDLVELNLEPQNEFKTILNPENHSDETK